MNIKVKVAVRGEEKEDSSIITFSGDDQTFTLANVDTESADWYVKTLEEFFEKKEKEDRTKLIEEVIEMAERKIKHYSEEDTLEQVAFKWGCNVALKDLQEALSKLKE
jgi:hypothetical protein